MGDSVLVIGSGPTGLIVTHELLRRGIPCRLIDKRETPAGSTRAFTVHARTMEMFDHMGIAYRVEEVREVCPGNLFHFKGVDLLPDQQPKLDFRRLKNTRFNYYGKVNQNDLEQVLREALASKFSFSPEFGTECTAIEQTDDGITVKVKHRDGREEVAYPAWVIGADGVHSTVRSSLAVAFQASESYNMTMSMVDVRMRHYRGDPAWVNYYVADKGFMLVTSLPGNKYRLYLAGQLELLLKDAAPRAAFQQALDFFDTGAEISEMDWASTWEIHKVIAESYYRGTVFLCGDATHVHSPAGGQGMNACMQDAFNLGWKIAMVMRSEAPRSILDTYEHERRGIAEQVTEGANHMHQVLFNAQVAVRDRYTLTQNPDWHEEAIYRISGLSHNYRDHIALPSGPTMLEGGPAPGERAADAVLSTSPKRRLHDVFRHTGFTLLLLPVSTTEEETCRTLAREVTEQFGRRVKAVAVAATSIDGFDYDHMVVDETGEVGQVYGRSDQGRMVLVRPDLYVGYRSLLSEQESLFAHLRGWLL